jgi:hypothetical protein
MESFFGVLCKGGPVCPRCDGLANSADPNRQPAFAPPQVLPRRFQALRWIAINLIAAGARLYCVAAVFCAKNSMELPGETASGRPERFWNRLGRRLEDFYA